MTEKQPNPAFKLIQGQPKALSKNRDNQQTVSPELASLIEDVRLRWDHNARPVVTSHHQEQLLENPEWVFALLWDTVKHYEPEDGRGDFHIRLYLLGETLFCLGVDLQDQPSWVHDLATGIQREIARYLLVPEFPQAVQVEIVDAVFRARLPIDPEFKEAIHKVSSYDQRHVSQAEPYPLSHLLSSASTQGFAEPFGLARLMMEQMAALDLEKQFELVTLLAADDDPIVLEALGLLLLSPVTRIRRLVPELLRDLISLRKLSTINLRRMMMIRNWLPGKEQVVLDRLIREAKRHRIVSTRPMPQVDMRSFASALDGRGEMAVWSTIERHGTWMGCRLIFNLAQGLVDVDTRPLENAYGMDKELAMIRQNVFLLPISANFLEMAIGHFLAVGLRAGELPHFQLVQLMEWLGWQNMEPKAVPSGDVLADLLVGLTGRHRKPRNVQRVVAASRAKRLTMLTQSWLLQGEAVEKLLLSQLGGPNHWISNQQRALDLICDEFLEADREAWFARLVWKALWLKNAGRAGQTMWKYMATLAQQMQQGRPIKELPLLRCVAERTLINLVAQARNNAAKGHPTLVRMVSGK